MSEKLTFKYLPPSQQPSDYDWMNIDRNSVRVGKVRGLIEGKQLTIYSINIFPEYERHGYARQTIKMFQSRYDTIIADRVRPPAVGFWEKMGFLDTSSGNFVWRYSKAKEAVDE